MKHKQAELNPKLFIQPSSVGSGFGAFVREPVAAQEVLFTIPRSACITLDNAIDDVSCGELYRKLIDKAGPGGNTVAMAGFLATEWLKVQHDVDRGIQGHRDYDMSDADMAMTNIGGSEYAPYLQALPWERGMNDQEHVLYWSDADVERWLAGTKCYDEAKALRGEVDLATRVLNSITGPSIRVYRGEITAANDEASNKFKWPWERQQQRERTKEMLNGFPQAVQGAFVTLLTRAFQDGDADQEKLVPMLDMLQHSDEPNVSHAMRLVDQVIEVRARRPIQAGEELFNQYRSEMEENMPYHRFFTRFGFVPGIREPVQNLLEDRSSIFFPQKAEL